MPRKQIIKRRVRRLKPSEIAYIVRGTVAYDDEIDSDYENYVDEARKAEKASRSLRGLYKNLAVIVEVKDE